MNNQKGFAPIVVVLIVVALLAGGFLTWQYFEAPKEAEDETADWKTYRNEEYGFEIKYPPESEVFTEPFIRFLISDLEITAPVDIFIFNNPGGLSVNQWLEEKEEEEPYYKAEYIEPVFVSGVKGIKFFINLGGVSPHSILINKEKLIYKINTYRGFDLIFNQMLSTFRLIEEVVKEEIAIISPIQGEKWEIGNTYQIRWTPSDPSRVVEIRLDKTDAPTAALANQWAKTNIPNTGSYDFTVPTELGKGGGGDIFQISVQDITKGYLATPTAYSGLFSIVSQ